MSNNPCQPPTEVPTESKDVTAVVVGVASQGTVGAVSAAVPRRLSKIILKDFRAFPNSAEVYEFDLGPTGKNILLHGENGSGKSSLFHALRLLLQKLPPTKAYAEYRHVFTQNTEGTITIELTETPTLDFKWEYGEAHPANGSGGAPFMELARRATFLDYKSLLQTSYVHETADHINVFDLIVNTLLREVELPSGSTVEQAWSEVRSFIPRKPPLKEADETNEDYAEVLREWPADEQQIDDEAETFRDQLNGLLATGIVSKANDFLAKLTAVPMLDAADQLIEKPTLKISLEVQSLKVASVAPVGRTHQFEKVDIALTATYAGKPITHPALFLNEARLTAIALSLYLAVAIETTPKQSSLGMPAIIVLDDALIGLDLAHRIPLLDLLNGPAFEGWQIFLFTYDAAWFEMAAEHLPKKQWLPARLFARAHPDGWELPILELEAPYLKRAWQSLESNDYKGAGVYLRSSFESVLRRFCEIRQLRLPFRNSLRDYSTEDFWPLIRAFEFKPDFRLVDPDLAGQVNIARKFVLNPLCHNDSSRPNREDIRRAYSAVFRLKVLLERDVEWLQTIDGKIRQYIVPLIGENEKLRERALKGLSPLNDFALASASQLLGTSDPPLADIACLLRSAIDQGLWSYCTKHGFDFTIKCNGDLTTKALWDQAVTTLRTAQPDFVSKVEAHRDLMIEEIPDRTVFGAKKLSDLESLRDALRGTSPKDKPKCVLRDW